MSATQEVFQLIEQDLAIIKCLTNGLLNSRALAKFLINKYNLLYTEEAVVSAIRRYETDFEKDNKLGDSFEGGMLFSKSDVVCLTTNISNQAKIGSILQDEELNKNLRLSRTKKYTKFVVYEKELEKLKEHFLVDQIVLVQNELIELRLLLKSPNHDTIGLLSKITAQIALYNIPIQEMIITLPEFLIYVKEKDGLKAQEALMDLLNNKS